MSSALHDHINTSMMGQHSLAMPDAVVRGEWRKRRRHMGREVTVNGYGLVVAACATWTWA
jgi:hypothetical protein